MTDILNPEGKITGSHGAGLGKYFAIIGTREPDNAQIEAAYQLAYCIAWLGRAIIKTGAAYGIDKAAMEGTLGHNLEVYLPWRNYNTEIIPVSARITVYTPEIHGAWADSVRRHHPAGNRLSRGAFALHARNYGIVEHCQGVIAFPNQSGEGGTGQGIRIAKYLGIPVIQGNKGTIIDTPRFIGKALQQLGLVSKDIPVTIQGQF